MSAHATPEQYFSGQGVMMLGRRTAAGKPIGLYHVGNVSDLKITQAQTNLEHKESSTGQRGTDKRLRQELKVGLSATMEKFYPKNLAIAMNALTTERAAGSVTGQELQFSPGGISPFQHIKVSAVVVSTATLYADESTPWDYKLNEDAGSIQWNDGSVLAFNTLGVTASGGAVGATTSITVANAFTVGQKVHLRGATGADAADLNVGWVTVVTANSTTITVNVNTTGKTIVFTTLKVVGETQKPTVAYSYAAQNLVDALTEGQTDYFMRFEGLNTADENKPVVVEVFRFASDPLKELALISDTLQQFVLEGSVLSDPLQPTGSKYYRILMY